MRRVNKIVILVVAIMLSGCSSNKLETEVKHKNSVERNFEKTMEQQVHDEIGGSFEEREKELLKELTDKKSVDLTEEEPEVTYNVIVSILNSIDKYKGAKVKMVGYYFLTGDDNNQYNLVATATDLSQSVGFEFITTKQDEVTLDDKTEIYVEGKLDTYKEKDSDTSFVVLKDAIVQLVERDGDTAEGISNTSN